MRTLDINSDVTSEWRINGAPVTKDEFDLRAALKQGPSKFRTAIEKLGDKVRLDFKTNPKDYDTRLIHEIILAPYYCTTGVWQKGAWNYSEVQSTLEFLEEYYKRNNRSFSDVINIVSPETHEILHAALDMFDDDTAIIILKALIKTNALAAGDLDSKDQLGNTVYHKAAYKKNAQLCYILEEAGIDTEATNLEDKRADEITLLSNPARERYKAISEYKLSPDKQEYLRELAKKGKARIFDAVAGLWLKEAPEPEKQARKGFIRGLIDNPAPKSMSLLHCARKEKNWDLVLKFIREYGADPNKGPNVSGGTYQMVISYAAQHESASVLRQLIELGATFNSKKDCDSALMAAIIGKNSKNVDLLLEKGVIFFEKLERTGFAMFQNLAAPPIVAGEAYIEPILYFTNPIDFDKQVNEYDGPLTQKINIINALLSTLREMETRTTKPYADSVTTELNRLKTEYKISEGLVNKSETLTYHHSIFRQPLDKLRVDSDTAKKIVIKHKTELRECFESRVKGLVALINQKIEQYEKAANGGALWRPDADDKGKLNFLFTALLKKNDPNKRYFLTISSKKLKKITEDSRSGVIDTLDYFVVKLSDTNKINPVAIASTQPTLEKQQNTSEVLQEAISKLNAAIDQHNKQEPLEVSNDIIYALVELEYDIGTTKFVSATGMNNGKKPLIQINLSQNKINGLDSVRSQKFTDAANKIRASVEKAIKVIQDEEAELAARAASAHVTTIAPVKKAEPVAFTIDYFNTRSNIFDDLASVDGDISAIFAEENKSFASPDPEMAPAASSQPDKNTATVSTVQPVVSAQKNENNKVEAKPAAISEPTKNTVPTPTAQPAISAQKNDDHKIETKPAAVSEPDKNTAPVPTPQPAVSTKKNENHKVETKPAAVSEPDKKIAPVSTVKPSIPAQKNKKRKEKTKPPAVSEANKKTVPAPTPQPVVSAQKKDSAQASVPHSEVAVIQSASMETEIIIVERSGPVAPKKSTPVEANTGTKKPAALTNNNAFFQPNETAVSEQATTTEEHGSSSKKKKTAPPKQAKPKASKRNPVKKAEVVSVENSAEISELNAEVVRAEGSQKTEKFSAEEWFTIFMQRYRSITPILGHYNYSKNGGLHTLIEELKKDAVKHRNNAEILENYCNRLFAVMRYIQLKNTYNTFLAKTKNTLASQRSLNAASNSESAEESEQFRKIEEALQSPRRTVPEEKWTALKKNCAAIIEKTENIRATLDFYKNNPANIEPDNLSKRELLIAQIRNKNKTLGQRIKYFFTNLYYDIHPERAEFVGPNFGYNDKLTVAAHLYTAADDVIENDMERLNKLVQSNLGLTKRTGAEEPQVDTQTQPAAEIVLPPQEIDQTAVFEIEKLLSGLQSKLTVIKSLKNSLSQTEFAKTIKCPEFEFLAKTVPNIRQQLGLPKGAQLKLTNPAVIQNPEQLTSQIYQAIYVSELVLFKIQHDRYLQHRAKLETSDYASSAIRALNENTDYKLLELAIKELQSSANTSNEALKQLTITAANARVACEKLIPLVTEFISESALFKVQYDSYLQERKKLETYGNYSSNAIHALKENLDYKFLESAVNKLQSSDATSNETLKQLTTTTAKARVACETIIPQLKEACSNAEKNKTLHEGCLRLRANKHRAEDVMEVLGNDAAHKAKCVQTRGY